MIPKLKRTLYIGLGGTGFKTLLHTKRAFIETYGEVPPMIKFLAFDSDRNQYKDYVLPSIYGEVKFDPSESSDIMVSQAKGKVSHNRPELSWLPDCNIPAVVDLENGCGMVRTNGRIAFAFNYRKSRNNIQNALNQVRNLATVHSTKYNLISQDVEVNIVFSIAGGTGSGTFIDMAYLVKDIFREQALPETSKIVGYMVLPDVYDAQLAFGKERLFPNACGSLVDLDYLMHLDYDKLTPANYLTERTRPDRLALQHPDSHRQQQPQRRRGEPQRLPVADDEHGHDSDRRRAVERPAERGQQPGARHELARLRHRRQARHHGHAGHERDHIPRL